jgi:hypothetical protein
MLLLDLRLLLTCLTRQAILMQIPTGALQIVTLLIGIWVTNKFKLRWPVLA